MKKILYSAAVIAAMGIASNANAQLIDETNVTITMDLQPILQLNMNGPQNIDFVFDQISEYAGGIVQYGVTNLSVSSSVNWDLYAVGFATNATQQAVTNAALWDQQVFYGAGADPNATNKLPISLLELHQNVANSSTAAAVLSGNLQPDYSAAFSSAAVIGVNSIYACGSGVAVSPYTRPAQTEKYIAGHFDNITDFIQGGSYLTDPLGATGVFYYAMDYRIKPSLPATFPNAGDNLGVTHDLNAVVAGNYAQPGVYTMNVKYVLMEN
jgi:hypothetical protein